MRDLRRHLSDALTMLDNEMKLIYSKNPFYHLLSLGKK